VFVLALVAVLTWSQVVLASSGELLIKFYDVGQGDSIYIQTPAGYKILVDGGPNNRVVDYLNKDLGVGQRELDLVILTHPQEDHLKGLIEVVRRFPVKKVLVTNATHTTASFQMWTDVLGQQNLKPETVVAGDTVNLTDGVSFKFVWPRPEIESPKDLNEASAVFKLTFGEFDVLLTGDADAKNQPYSGNIGDIEVLKVPHHGAKTGLKEDFLSELKPEIAVISLSKNNTYGHPGANIIQMLSAVGSKIYRTDQNGTVQIVSDGEKWYTRTEK